MNNPRRWITIPLLMLVGCGTAPSTQQQAAAPRRTIAPATVAPHIIQPTQMLAPLPAVYAASEAAPDTAAPRPTVLVESVVNDPDVVQLVAALSKRGLAPQATDISRVALLESAPGQAYQLGDGRLFLHVYPSADAAAVMATELSDESNWGGLDWVAPPYFFRCERIIALYLGTDERAIAALTELCRLPFVQSPALKLPAPTEPPLITVDVAINSIIRSIPSMQAVSAPFVRRIVPLASGVALLYTYDVQRDDQLLAVTHLSYLLTAALIANTTHADPVVLGILYVLHPEPVWAPTPNP